MRLRSAFQEKIYKDYSAGKIYGNKIIPLFNPV